MKLNQIWTGAYNVQDISLLLTSGHDGRDDTQLAIMHKTTMNRQDIFMTTQTHDLNFSSQFIDLTLFKLVHVNHLDCNLVGFTIGC
jgi:hypothetical protein